MLRRVRPALFVLVALAMTLPARADSPLFSSDISSAYAEVPAVAHATESGLDANTNAVLADAAVTSDVRAAVIQAASQQTGAGGALVFHRYLADKKGRPVGELEATDLATHELFALGYLLALDPDAPLGSLVDQNPTLIDSPSKLVQSKAMALLQAAQERNPQDFTPALILALAKGNEVMSKDFCQVYREVEAVRSSGLKINLRPQAVKNVLDYISLYKEDCNEKTARQSARKTEPWRNISSKSTSRMSFDAQGRIVGASSSDTALRIFSSQDGTLLRTIDTGEFTDSPAWLEGGRYLAFGDWKPSLHLYDGTTFAEIFNQPLPDRALSVALPEHSDGTNPPQKLLVVGLFNGQIALHALEDGRQFRIFKAHDKYVSSIVVTEDQKLVTGSYDATVGVFDWMGTLLKRTNWPAGSFVEGSGKAVLVRDFGDRWRWLDPISGKTQGEAIQVGATLHDVAAHPTRPVVAAALSSGVVSLFDSQSGKLLFDLLAHEDQVLSVDFSADGELMLTGSSDGTLRLWKVAELLGS